MLKLSETLFVQLLRRTPVLGFCKHCLLGTPFSLWPHAIGTQDCQKRDPLGTQFLVKWGPNGDLRQQNGDPNSACFQNLHTIFSEMGTKWGPSLAEWGPKKRMFAKLIETI